MFTRWYQAARRWINRLLGRPMTEDTVLATRQQVRAELRRTSRGVSNLLFTGVPRRERRRGAQALAKKAGRELVRS